MTWQDLMQYQLGSITVGSILTTIVVFVVGYFVCKLIMKIVTRILDKSKVDPTLAGFIKVAVRVVLYFVLAVIVAGALGINTLSLVAVFSVFGLALSLAAENSLSNLAGGLTLLVSRPFQTGDFVEAGGGKSGTVQQVSLIYTHLLTVDNKDVYIPNSAVTSNVITNFSREDNRRVDLTFTASYDCPVQKVVAVLKEAITGVEGVLSEPEPFVNVTKFGESGIDYVVRVWTKNADYWTVNFALLNKVKEAFDANGVEIPYNKLDVKIINK